MAKYRKRPVVIEAEQWFPGKDVEGVVPLPEYVKGKSERRFLKAVLFASGEKVDTNHLGVIETLEGPHLVCPGDWIITGIKGEKYPCKPDVFVRTYEPVDGEDSDATEFVHQYDEFHDFWECQKCGLAWMLTEGGPEENEMYYCPKCGRKIIGCIDAEEDTD